MSNLRPKTKVTARDVLKVACGLFGLMAGIVFLIWAVARLLR